MEQDGSQPFVPDEWVPGAATAVLGQNPGAEEARLGRPFVGPAGAWLEEKCFPRAMLRRGVNVSLANVLKCRWRGSNALPPDKVLRGAVAHCTQAHLTWPPEVEVVVACGNLAWEALGGQGKITDWRGWVKP